MLGETGNVTDAIVGGVVQVDGLIAIALDVEAEAAVDQRRLTRRDADEGKMLNFRRPAKDQLDDHHGDERGSDCREPEEKPTEPRPLFLRQIKEAARPRDQPVDDEEYNRDEDQPRPFAVEIQPLHEWRSQISGPRPVR